MLTSVPHDPVTDPDALAMLFVQQYLNDMGYTAALRGLEQQTHMRFVEAKLPRGSMLLEMVYRHLEEEAGGDEEAQAASHAAAEEEALLTASAPPLPCRLVSSFDGLHVAAVTSLAVAEDGSALFSGAGNGVVMRLTVSGEEVWATNAGSGGILSLALLPATSSGEERLVATAKNSGIALLDAREERLVATAMDGGVALLDAASGAVLATAKPHRKYAVKAAALADGRFVTASWDGTLAVHRVATDGAAIETLAVETYDHAVADLTVLADGKTVVIAEKESCFLQQYDTSSLQAADRINMNDKEWDTTLSFSATTTSVSPCGKFLLVSTDGPRIMVFRVRDFSKARILYGLQTASQFHQHVAVWYGSSTVIAAAEGGAAFVFSIASGKVVDRLKAHPGSNVRAMATDVQRNRVFTGSFDKTVKAFSA